MFSKLKVCKGKMEDTAATRLTLVDPESAGFHMAMGQTAATLVDIKIA